MKKFNYLSLIFVLIFFRGNYCNPLNPFPGHVLAHPGFIQPAIVPLYPMQYPFPFHQHLTSNPSSQEDYQQSLQTAPSKEATSTAANKGTKKEEEGEDDDVNKREDEDTFWEAASSYGKNRWTNFKDGFTELWDVFRAAGRGFKNILVGGE